jgi:hypothetical protein
VTVAVIALAAEVYVFIVLGFLVNFLSVFFGCPSGLFYAS